MTELDRIYSRAKEAGAEAEAIAKVNAKYLSREQLEAEYVSLCGLVAYYGKLERDQIGNPIRHFEALRKAFREAEGEVLLREQNPEMVARILVSKRDAILDLLAQTQLLLGEFNLPTATEVQSLP